MIEIFLLLLMIRKKTLINANCSVLMNGRRTEFGVLLVLETVVEKNQNISSMFVHKNFSVYENVFSVRESIR